MFCITILPFCAPLIASGWLAPETTGGVTAIPVFFKVGLLLKALAMSLSIWQMLHKTEIILKIFFFKLGRKNCILEH